MMIQSSFVNSCSSRHEAALPEGGVWEERIELKRRQFSIVLWMEEEMKSHKGRQ